MNAAQIFLQSHNSPLHLTHFSNTSYNKIKLIWCKRLGNIVRCTPLDSFDSALNRSIGSNHHNLDPWISMKHQLQQIKPVRCSQTQINKDKIKHLTISLCHGIPGIADRFHKMASRFHKNHKSFANVNFIINNEDIKHSARDLLLTIYNSSNRALT